MSGRQRGRVAEGITDRRSSRLSRSRQAAATHAVRVIRPPLVLSGQRPRFDAGDWKCLAEHRPVHSSSTQRRMRQMRKHLEGAVGILIAISVFSAAAYGQSTVIDTLEIIGNYVDRICGLVALKGGANSWEVRGDIKAELKGLAAKLAEAGVSGGGKITSDEYTNVVRDQLAGVWKTNQTCRVTIDKELRATLLPTPLQPPPPNPYYNPPPPPVTPPRNTGRINQGYGTVCCPLIGTIGTCTVSLSPLNSSCSCEMTPFGGPMITNQGSRAPPSTFQGFVCK